MLTLTANILPSASQDRRYRQDKKESEQKQSGVSGARARLGSDLRDRTRVEIWCERVEGRFEL